MLETFPSQRQQLYQSRTTVHSSNCALLSRACGSGTLSIPAAQAWLPKALKLRPDLFCPKWYFKDMQSVLIIVPAGGMLFEAAGIAEILMHANQLKSKDSHKQLYQVTIAATQPHRVVQGLSGVSLLADCRLSDLDPRQRRDTIIITSKGP